MPGYPPRHVYAACWHVLLTVSISRSRPADALAADALSAAVLALAVAALAATAHAAAALAAAAHAAAALAAAALDILISHRPIMYYDRHSTHFAVGSRYV